MKKKRTFRLSTDYCLKSVTECPRIWDSKKFSNYIKENIQFFADLSLNEEKGNPRFYRKSLIVKNIEIFYRDGYNTAMVETKIIDIFFDTHCTYIPSSLKRNMKKMLENYDETLSPALLFVVKQR